MSELLLERLLAPGALRAVFQPIFECDTLPRPVHYLEGLIRGPLETNLQYPDVLFSYARRKRAEIELDRAAVRAVLGAARTLEGLAVGVNVHARTLATDLGFASFLGDLMDLHDVAPERLVVEVVEQGWPGDFAAFRSVRQALRDIGVRVALDDFGSGLSNHRMLLEARPDYLKIDGHLVRGCSHDLARRAVLRSTALLALQLGAIPVAEGVEQQADLDTALSAGISLVQGYLLARPGPANEWGELPTAAN